MSNRIHNGHAAAANQFPHQVALFIPIGADASVCGGSIISNLWILTAAHCLHNRRQVTLRFGSIHFNSADYSHTTERIINHPNFHTITLNHDVSLVRTNTPIPLSSGIRVIRLPTRNQEHTPFTGQTATVSGWGEVFPGSGTQALLRWVDVRIISNDQCRASFNPGSVVNHVVCTLGNGNIHQGICGGDSGGPLFIVENGVRTLVGVVAFGAPANRGGCAAGHPSGYMRTSHFLPWINQHTGIPMRF